MVYFCNNKYFLLTENLSTRRSKKDLSSRIWKKAKECRLFRRRKLSKKPNNKKQAVRVIRPKKEKEPEND